MSEEKKNLIRDVTGRLDKLPPERQRDIIWYMRGVIDTEEARSDQKQKRKFIKVNLIKPYIRRKPWNRQISQ